MGILQMEDVGSQAGWMPQEQSREALVMLSFDTDSRSHSENHILQLRDHRTAAGSLLRHGMLIIDEQSPGKDL